MTGPLYHLGRFCARHHWLVIAAWIVAAVGLAFMGRAAGHHTSDDLTLPGTDSTKATDVLEKRLPDQAYGSNPLALVSHNGRLTDSKSKQAVDDTVKQVRNTPHVVKAVNPLGDEGKAFLSKDKTIAYIPVSLDVSQSDITKDEAQQVLDAGDPARAAGIDVSLGGYAGQQLSKPSTHQSEAIGLAAAAVILLFAFGTATAMALPIVTAVLGLVSSLALISVLGVLTDVPTTAPTLATMIGLGVGIDYALFIVTRHKLQLRDGMEMQESIARATATAGGAVLFAGTTVVIALGSLVFAGIPLVTKLGYSAAVAVVVSVVGATTLLPALLGALGPRINSLRVKLGRTHPDDHRPHGWARWARGVAKRPWRSLVASTAVLVVLALPVLDLHLGQSDVGAMPTSTTVRQAYDAIGEGFGEGTNGPLLVAAELGKPAKPDQKNLDKLNKQQKQLKQKQSQIEQTALLQGATQQQAEAEAGQQTQKQSDELAKKKKKRAETPASDPRLTDFSDALAKAPGVKSVSPPTLDKRGNAAVYTVISDSAPSSNATEDLVNHLRSTTIPQATKGTDITAQVGGQTAGYVDLAERISEKLPAMIAIVVGLSFVVLMLAFRSLVVPAKAAIMNLLSVGAAYGWSRRSSRRVGARA
jgi:putative drug exporter of the RND superfamily